MSDYTQQLPPELKHMVCSFLPKSDLVTVRRFNKQWSSVAASPLWQEFFAVLYSDIPNSTFEALLVSEPCGFLDNVKVLDIRECKGTLTVHLSSYDSTPIMLSLYVDRQDWRLNEQVHNATDMRTPQELSHEVHVELKNRARYT
jgi:hypothetical protein